MGKSNTLLKGDEDLIISILELPNNKIISASREGTYKIWNLKSNKCIKTVKDQSIRSITALPNGNVASCLYENFIKIWKYANEDFQCIQTLTIDGYTCFSQIIALSNNNLVCTGHYKWGQYVIIFDYNNQYRLSRSIIQDGNVTCITQLFNNTFGYGSR
jgi:WD40 repeat protein